MFEDSLRHLPPQELEAEQQFLGACLMEPRTALGQARVRAEDFYKGAHSIIYAAMQTIKERGEDVDIITASSELKDAKELQLVGGPATYLSQLITQTPSAANCRSHEALIISAAQRRAVIRAAGDIQQAAYEGRDIDALVSDGITKLNAIRRLDAGEIVPYHEIVQSAFTSIEKRCENPGKLTGIPTGFAGIDRMTNGWQPGWKYTIAGRPGMGKTALAMQMAPAGAAAGFPVGVISLEMTKEQVALRDISRTADIPLSRILAGALHEADWPRLTHAAMVLHGHKMYFAFTAFGGAQEARIIDDMVQRLGVKIVFIDYLQLQNIKDHRGNREQEVSALSAMHKRKAKEHNIPVIELSQLNRDVEKRLSKKPTLADLRESGSIEQDADFVGFIYREDCKCPRNADCACGNRHQAWFSGAKGRMNEIGDVELVWKGKTTSFKDVENTE